jgi:hypothetical protein
VTSITAEIPIFGKIVKRAHRNYKRKEIAPVLKYLRLAELPCSAIAKVRHDTGILSSTLQHWHDSEIDRARQVVSPL